MSIDEIKNLTRRSPFRPFEIELENGRVVTIGEDTEILFPRSKPDLVIAFPNGQTCTFEAKAVTALRQ